MIEFYLIIGNISYLKDVIVITFLDRAVDDCLSTVIHRVQSLSYQFEGRLELHIIGGFADTRRISHQLSVSLLRKLCVSHDSIYLILMKENLHLIILVTKL